MEKTKEFQGKLLISVTDGKNLGEIKDVYLDKEAKEVIAVYLGKTGLLSRKTHLIHIDEIRLFGTDAWLVNGSDKIVGKEEVEGSDQFILAEDLRGRAIQTDGKTRLGTIGDILVDGRMNVLGFSFDKLSVEGPLSATRQIARGALTTIGDPIVASLEKAEQLKVEELPRNSKPF